MVRALAATCARSASPTPRTIIAGTLAATRRSRRGSGRACSTPASIRASIADDAARRRGGARSAPSIEDGAQGRHQPRRRPHPAPLHQPRRSRDAHQLLPDRRRTACRADHRVQVRVREGRGPAAAAAALRDLRLFAARRGRAPALRQGGARRPALVGPAAGFPHRGARPRQGAAGQERRDRAGRRQGRLRAEAARRPPRDRDAWHGGGHRELPHLRAHAARAHRQPRRRPDRAAGRHGAPRRRRSLSRRRRRQGHGDLLRHRQRHLDREGPSGSAMPSPPAAARATTTRRWASPRAAPGRR